LQEIFSGEELDMKKEQVLLIEDDADIREGVRILLESENYCVEEAENGKSGLELLSDETDLVILDIMMPGMSGLRTCEEIRKVSNVPVLFLTAKAQESDKLIGLMAGGDDYLAKPFSYAELLGRVKALLRRYNIYRGRNNEVREEAETYLRRLMMPHMHISKREKQVSPSRKIYTYFSIFQRFHLLPRPDFAIMKLTDISLALNWI